jgi:hypothetical protein
MYLGILYEALFCMLTIITNTVMVQDFDVILEKVNISVTTKIRHINGSLTCIIISVLASIPMQSVAFEGKCVL